MTKAIHLNGPVNLQIGDGNHQSVGGAARSLQSCNNLADVLTEFDLVDYICIVRPKGTIDFLSGSDAKKWLARNFHILCEWRREYGLCSIGPESGMIAFIIHAKR